MMANNYGVVAEHAAPRKGYSDFVQHTGPMISGQLRLVLNEPQTLRGSLRDAQTLRVTFGYSQTAHNSYRVEQSLCRRNSRVQIKQEQYSGSETPMKSVGSRRDGADLLHEKGSAANAALWDDCFFNHEENQYSPVLDDNRLSLSELGQPFGSMPSRSRRWRQASFTQALKLPSPATESICSNRASSKRIIFLVLPERSVLFFEFLSCIGSYRYVRFALNGMNHFIGDYHKKQRPGVFAALPRRLTTNDRLDIEVAMLDHITPLTGRNSLTPNKFTWRFLALNRHDKKAKPCRLSVEAYTEQEARRELAPHFILSLAARLPVQEVSHV